MDCIKTSCLPHPPETGLSLNRDKPAVHFWQAIFKNFFITMISSEDGLKQNSDVEFLHDFRVAVRRTRSALEHSEGVFSRDKISSFKRQFSKLGKATGLARDLDVLIFLLCDEAKKASEERAKAFAFFLDFLKNKRNLEQKKMVRRLNSANHENFKRNWELFLASHGREIAGPKGFDRAGSVADRQVSRLLKSIMKKGASITHVSPPEKLHALRKKCKKLRYLLESCRSLYPEDEVVRVIKALKKLQDGLGEFQDMAVQKQVLSDFSLEMKNEGVCVETLKELDWLAGKLNKKAEKIKIKFPARFASIVDKFGCFLRGL